MREFTLIFFLFISTQCISQEIYKGFDFGMSKTEAKNEFRDNKEEYKTIDLGNGFIYRIYHQNFTYSNDQLAGITLTPKGAAMGQSYESVVSYLEYTRAFFEKLDYSTFFEPEYWNGPHKFSSKYGLLMIDPDKNKVVQIYPVKAGGVFNTRLDIYNHDQFMEWYEEENDRVEEKAENSGF